MKAALKNLTSLPLPVVEGAFREARDKGTRILITSAHPDSPMNYDYMTVGEFNLACAKAGSANDPRQPAPPEKLATARPGGVVNEA